MSLVIPMSEAFVGLLGATLVAPNGSEVQTRAALANKSVVGLYFSAHWCPPCRMFTPMLSEKFRTAYRGKGMEIVFVSSDRDEHSFKEYHQSMPWLALPFVSHQIKQNLSIKYGVSGIPCLIILDFVFRQMNKSLVIRWQDLTTTPSVVTAHTTLFGIDPLKGRRCKLC